MATATQWRNRVRNLTVLGAVASLIATVVVAYGALTDSLELATVAGAVTVLFATKAMASSARRRVSVLVAPDGIRLSWSGVETFLSYGEIRELRVYHQKSDDRYRIDAVDMDGRPVSFEGSRETIASVYERIEEYRAEFGGHLDARASLLARGEDDGASWLERLGSVELTGGYRDALSEDGLWAIVENPASPPTARAAAALVLRRAPKNRERLGTISSFVATPKVRVALERCAEEDATEQELHEVALEVTDRRATAPSGRAR